MPLNLLKKYPELLELTGSLRDMNASLKRIYVRDIEDNPDFKFRGIFCIIFYLLAFSGAYSIITKYECLRYPSRLLQCRLR